MQQQSPSIGTATGTLVDSSNKHNVAVRCHYDFMHKYAAGSDEDTMLRDSTRFMIQMHEVLVQLKGYVHGDDDKDPLDIKNSAYPPVVSTLGSIPPEVRRHIKDLYACRTLNDMHDFVNDIQQPPNHVLIPDVPFFMFGGISVGRAYAHPSSGDTVCGAQIGGMVTVTNGHWPICSGDKVQWYFMFEADQFDIHGLRLDQGANNGEAQDMRDNTVASRKRAAEDQYGTYNTNRGADFVGKAATSVQVKSCCPKFGARCYGDLIRVFGVAQNNARPWDKVDILMCKQSN